MFIYCHFFIIRRLTFKYPARRYTKKIKGEREKKSEFS